MARIAVAGWQHETNTFAPVKADFAAFEQASGWPGLSRGRELFDAVEGVHLPITGAMEVLDHRAVLAALDPAVAGPELEAREARVVLQVGHGLVQGIEVEAVHVLD